MITPRRLVVAATSVVLLAGVSTALAAPSHAATHSKCALGPKVKCVGAHLQKANLKGRDLRGANLQRADLRRANLQGANLQGADLRSANLQGANLSGANIKRARFNSLHPPKKATRPRTAKSETSHNPACLPSCSGANLSSAILNGAGASGADFSYANLTNAQLMNGYFASTRFMNATMTGAHLSDDDNITYKPSSYAPSITVPGNTGDFEQANFSSCQCSGIMFVANAAEQPGLNFSGANLTGIDWYRAWLKSPNFTDANITSGQFGATTFDYPDFTRANLHAVNLTSGGTNAVFNSPYFNRTKSGALNGTATLNTAQGWLQRGGYFLGSTADLTNGTLTNIDMGGVNLSNAVFTGLASSGLTGTPTLASTAKIQKGHVIANGVNLANTDLTGANLSGVPLDQATFTGVATNGTGGVTCPTSVPTDWSCSGGFLVGPSANLTNANLVYGGLNSLVARNLRGANFTSATLTDIDFTNATLTNGTWTNAQVGGANFTNANLSGSNWVDLAIFKGTITGPFAAGGNPSGVPIHTLLKNGFMVGPGVKAHSVDLSGTNFSSTGLSLTGADLTSANLTGANFTNVNMSKAVISSATVSNTTFPVATIDSNAMSGIRGIGLVGTPAALTTQAGTNGLPLWSVKSGVLAGPEVNLSGANLSGKDLSGVYLRNADLSNTTLSGGSAATAANFSGSDLGCITATNGCKDSKSTSLYNAVADYVTFENGNLSNAYAEGAFFTHANFKGTNMTTMAFTAGVGRFTNAQWASSTATKPTICPDGYPFSAPALQCSGM